MNAKNNIFFILFFIYFVFLCNIDKNSIVISPDIKRGVNKLLPQGWGFFTKDPRDDVYQLFKYDLNGDFEKITIKNNSIENLIGFSRKSRKISSELSILLSKIPDSLWTEHSQVGEDFFEIRQKELITILSEGKYLVEKKRTIPWAWIGKTSQKKCKYFKFYLIKSNAQ
ncbi:SdpA family antimicrobial peptide system protein [Capnocytophaga canimorsus]